jgi:hypothetical protein
MRVTLLFSAMLAFACSAQTPLPHRWTQFVQVEGQPEPVPAEWVATPEGKLAHSIKLPRPLPKESGYRPGMTSEQYFDRLCKGEAGEFIYKTVENVSGLYLARPPKRPTDDDLKDRYKLEAPEIERTFQLFRATTEARATTFVNPPWALYSFVEEPNQDGRNAKPYVHVAGYKQDTSPMKVERTVDLKSRFGMIWRGIRRTHDREHGIAGGEWIVFELKTTEVLAVLRDYGRTGFTPNAPDGIWWLNAVNCPNSPAKHIRSSRIYDFATKSLKPAVEGKK